MCAAVAVASADWLWTKLRRLFDSDDGSLPEIRVLFADPAAIPKAYLTLLALRTASTPPEGSFCSTTDDQDQSVSAVLNPAEFVLEHKAHPFHAFLGTLQLDHGTLPEMGVSVDHAELRLDYRMGPAWGPPSLLSLFELLLHLLALDPCATPTLEEHAYPVVLQLFRETWEIFRAQHTQLPEAARAPVASVAVSTQIPDLRPISPQEAELIRMTLDRAPTSFVHHVTRATVDDLRVITRCACGCPTIDFEPPTWGPRPHIIADAIAESKNGCTAGVIVWGRPDIITSLEIYELDARSTHLELPEPTSVRSWGPPESPGVPP